MPRIALIVAYSGKKYHGWQYQNETIPTIQKELTNAVSKVADDSVILHAAGRTDSGVHATKQVVHFDSAVSRPDKAWVLGSNVQLPEDVSVEWASEVGDHFDARRSAVSRHYLYLIQNTKVRSALMHAFLSHEHRVLDADAMNESAQALLGKNDFSSFRAANCQSIPPMRNITRIAVKRVGDLVMVDIVANAFLHHMVRNIVGALVDVGSGERPIGWIEELLSLADRSAGSRTASPNGLALINVVYPFEFGIPEEACLPHVYRMLDIAGF